VVIDIIFDPGNSWFKVRVGTTFRHRLRAYGHLDRADTATPKNNYVAPYEVVITSFISRVIDFSRRYNVLMAKYYAAGALNMFITKAKVFVNIVMQNALYE
jgi:hypothetical protein